jgi:ribosomal protein S1
MKLDDLNLNELDKNLSETERQEWNSIYASLRAGSLLTGKIVGTDMVSASHPVNCLVVITYRVKVLIPETEIWHDEKETRPLYVLRAMAGAMIDYVITDVDRKGECAVASRRLALGIRRRALAKQGVKSGNRLPCRVLAVGQNQLLAEVGGYDIKLTQRDLSYAMLPDLREIYRPGNELVSVVKEVDLTAGLLSVSVKEAEPHPFDGAEKRHPVGCRRASKITGKYSGGVFCRLDRNLDCMCIYSQNQQDADFEIGCEVILIVTKYDILRKRIYGKIVAKW